MRDTPPLPLYQRYQQCKYSTNQTLINQTGTTFGNMSILIPLCGFLIIILVKLYGRLCDKNRPHRYSKKEVKSALDSMAISLLMVRDGRFVQQTASDASGGGKITATKPKRGGDNNIRRSIEFHHEITSSGKEVSIASFLPAINADNNKSDMQAGAGELTIDQAMLLHEYVKRGKVITSIVDELASHAQQSRQYIEQDQLDQEQFLSEKQAEKIRDEAQLPSETNEADVVAPANDQREISPRQVDTANHGYLETDGGWVRRQKLIGDAQIFPIMGSENDDGGGHNKAAVDHMVVSSMKAADV